MTNVTELKPYQRISDLKLENNYLGKVISESLVALNQNVMGKLSQPTKLEKGSLIAVKVTKIMLPYKVELEMISESYNVVQQTTQEFLIRSEILEKLKPKFLQAAELIKNAIAESRPIILKHHADCDGYVGAIALQRAISPLVARKHRNAPWHYFKRTASRAPYYDYTDALKDISMSLDNIQHQKPPLIIIVDTGSTSQDLLSLKRIAQYGITTIVIDHHKPTMENNKSVVEQNVDLFINPHLVGGDNNLCAGMLGVELARFLTKTPNLEHLPAIAGICDKSKGADLDQYVELAKKKGYSKEFMEQLGQCIDFDAYYIGRMSSDNIEEILFASMEQQKHFVEIIKSKIEERKAAVIKSADKYAITHDFEKFAIVEIEIQDILDFRTYPPSGKAAGIIFAHTKQKSDKPVIVLGCGRDFITIRSNIPEFDLNIMIEKLSAKLPHAQLSGGGHAVAGTIRFIEKSKQEVLDFVVEYLKQNHGSN